MNLNIHEVKNVEVEEDSFYSDTRDKTVFTKEISIKTNTGERISINLFSVDKSNIDFKKVKKTR